MVLFEGHFEDFAHAAAAVCAVCCCLLRFEAPNAGAVADGIAFALCCCGAAAVDDPKGVCGVNLLVCWLPVQLGPAALERCLCGACR
jgi:hypothetical protein